MQTDAISSIVIYSECVGVTSFRACQIDISSISFQRGLFSKESNGIAAHKLCATTEAAARNVSEAPKPASSYCEVSRVASAASNQYLM